MMDDFLARFFGANRAGNDQLFNGFDEVFRDMEEMMRMFNIKNFNIAPSNTFIISTNYNNNKLYFSYILKDKQIPLLNEPENRNKSLRDEFLKPAESSTIENKINNDQQIPNKFFQFSINPFYVNLYFYLNF